MVAKNIENQVFGTSGMIYLIISLWIPRDLPVGRNVRAVGRNVRAVRWPNVAGTLAATARGTVSEGLGCAAVARECNH